MNEISLRKYLEQIEGLVEQGHYTQAIAHGKHILKQYPKHVATYRSLGKAMLEAGQDEYATDMFRRVLSADPEDLVAWVGMSEVHNKRGELDAATWCLERAFEMTPDNEIVAEELRRLYGQRDGVEPQRVQLTRAALARLYLKGDLLARAINEFRTLLVEHPDRADLRVALAEALWRNEQRLEAAEVCQQVLDTLPYCLKANLILGEIWTSSGREEGQVYLRRAEALDPENLTAQEFLGTTSPLPAREVQIVPLEYTPSTEKERPSWMAGIEAGFVEGPALAEREAAPFDITTAKEAQIEIPAWLEEGGGEEATAPAPPMPAEMAEEQPAQEVVPTPAEEFPAWLAGIRERLVEEAPEVTPEEEEEEVPEWLAGLGLEPIGDEEVTEQLAASGPEPAGEAPPPPSVELPPDWMAGIRALFTEEPELPEEAPSPEEIVPVPAPAAEGVPKPAWLEGEGMPSGDEAVAWLEQLAAGKEEELRAQAQAEAELRMAEIMGRVAPAEVPPEKVVPEEEAFALPTEEAVAPPAEEPFGWTQFGEPEAPPEAVTAVEEAPSVEEIAPAPAPAAEEAPLPAWLEGEGMPSGDEALAWLEQLAAGKEEELRAQAQAEAELRMVEIMGRVAPAEAPPEEAMPEKEAFALPTEEAVAPPAEEPFGWTQFGEPEAPPEAVAAVEETSPIEKVPWEAAAEIPLEEAALPPAVEEMAWEAAPEIPLEEIAPPPAVEQVPGVAEIEMPEPLKEAVAPPAPEIPAVEAPSGPFAAERVYLKDHPRDYTAWLTLAQALWQATERQEALEAYTRVIRAGKFLDKVIADLEECVIQWPDASTQRALGDAYMKDGRLQEALSVYRRALGTL
jgi:tetratricopeptide (TPR) repeat protein